MIKKITKILGICILTCFSFYYTDKIIDVSKSKDPIMIEIMKEEENYRVAATNAITIEDYIIPGISGTKVDVEKSYEKMKKLGEYNENLLIFISDYPKISIKDNYDKFIIKGSSKEDEVALIIKATNIANIKDIVNILNKNDVPANIYIDKDFIKENIQVLEELDSENIIFANGGCDNYEELCLKETNILLKNFEDYDNKYCYVTNDNYNVLNSCSNNSMYTIKPVITNEINPYSTIKSNLKSGNIYLLNDNNYTIKELEIIINYINQKGYEIVKMANLLDEE